MTVSYGDMTTVMTRTLLMPMDKSTSILYDKDEQD